MSSDWGSQKLEVEESSQTSLESGCQSRNLPRSAGSQAEGRGFQSVKCQLGSIQNVCFAIPPHKLGIFTFIDKSFLFIWG